MSVSFVVEYLDSNDFSAKKCARYNYAPGSCKGRNQATTETADGDESKLVETSSCDS